MAHVRNQSRQMPTVAPGNCNGKPGRHSKAQKETIKRIQERPVFIRNATRNTCLFLLRKNQNMHNTLSWCGCKKRHIHLLLSTVIGPQDISVLQLLTGTLGNLSWASVNTVKDEAVRMCVMWGWRDVLVLRSNTCSSWEPWFSSSTHTGCFSSQHPHWVVHSHMQLQIWESNPLFWHPWTTIHMSTYKQTHKLTHTKTHK